ncbi:hypothetical protein IKE07_01435 [Candidatus Saccharibacteria bacterium]|nr:hypothetical protein [Candidatus Saccharibacteria bacterium]
MNGNFTVISSKEPREYIFSHTGSSREAYPAIIAYQFENGNKELGLALIGSDERIIYYMWSDRLIQLYRSMLILDHLKVISENSLCNCFMLASRHFSSRTEIIIDHLERIGINVMEIQANVFTNEMNRRELDKMMKTIANLGIDVATDELKEELKIRYIPETKWIKRNLAATAG